MTSFQLYVWPHHLLILSPPFASAGHRHHAAQIAFGLNGPVVFESPRNGLQRADMLLIPPDTLHAHPAFGASAFLYLEPESIEWTHFSGCEDGRFVPLPFKEQLRSLARRAAAGDAVAAQSLADALIGQSPGRSPRNDALILRACTLIRQSLDGSITLAALAHAVRLSSSRLAHRFREATGVPVRRYVLWCRLRAAADAAMRGASLTDAAHFAGFADSAHLSRTFRAMFGIAPSLLFTSGRTAVTFCETAAAPKPENSPPNCGRPRVRC
ncbi:MAG TPA: AraC family transcriptional regulator [Terriglobales bacterium]|nr:AraC family transcriptional regulator [Terriglobales bacterium]